MKEKTMELDEMKNAWLALDRRLERQEALNLKSFREGRLDRLRASLRPMLIGRIVQIVFGALLAMTFAPFWIEHLATPHLAVIGASLHAYALMLIVGGARDIYLIRRIDYAAPVVEIQLRLAELRAWLLESAPVFGVAGCFIWVPFVLWAFMVLFGADIYAHAPEVVYWLLASSAVCLIPMLLVLRWVRRPGRSKWAALLERSIVPKGVYKAQRFLDEITAFAREG
ncbi:MAG TPA: hypothetical protein VFL30_05535 [Rhodanobacteraceae bacterium]|nr:hypothetical protein [Rhodanobacteraceae bacterium]